MPQHTEQFGDCWNEPVCGHWRFPFVVERESERGAPMSFRISPNLASMTAQRFLDKNQRVVEKSLSSLASGSRITRAGDDAAGFAIAESLRGQIAGSRQAKFNAQNAVGLIQTAEGGLNEQNNILIRLRELAVYSASDTVGDTEREYLDKEFQQLSQEFDRIAKSTRFGNKELLTGSGEEFQFQVGSFKGEENVIHFALEGDTTGSSAGIDGLDIADQDNALSSLEEIDNAVQHVAGVRASFGAMQSRFQYGIDNLSVQAENLEAARSLIVDADIAVETSNLARANILLDTGAAVLSQANHDSGRVLRLLSG